MTDKLNRQLVDALLRVARRTSREDYVDDLSPSPTPSDGGNRSNLLGRPLGAATNASQGWELRSPSGALVTTVVEWDAASLTVRFLCNGDGGGDHYWFAILNRAGTPQLWLDFGPLSSQWEVRNLTSAQLGFSPTDLRALGCSAIAHIEPPA